MHSLGLARGTVRIVKYRPGWQVSFEKERRLLQKHLGGRIVAIEHIGSTAVPGLSAKPILDIAVGVHRVKDVRPIQKIFEKLGYERPHAYNRQNIMFAKGPDSQRTVYVHVMRYKGCIWKKDLAFRDWLRTHTSDRKAYQAMKVRLAEQYRDDRSSYTSIKKRFIRKILNTTR